MSMVISERRGAVAVLTLNNPDKLNALGGSLVGDLSEALDAAGSEPGIRAIVVTGAGKGFCSGAQLGADTFAAGGRIGGWMRGSINPLIAKFRASPLPIVNAINGPAAGAGFGIALIKAQVETAWSLPVAAALDEEARAQSSAFATEDLREGAKAFVEKRAPRFAGR